MKYQLFFRGAARPFDEITGYGNVLDFLCEKYHLEPLELLLDGDDEAEYFWDRSTDYGNMELYNVKIVSVK